MKNILIISGAIWGIYVLNLITFGWLNQFGIQPRTFKGLFGIVSSPFLHGSLVHIIGNTLPFVILGSIISVTYKESFWDVLLGITILSGFGTWLIGSGGTNHIGVSGVIFGMASFLITAGILTKHWVAMGVGLFVALFYGLPLFIGLIPLFKHVSYTSHWLGLRVVPQWLGCIGLAYRMRINLKET